MSAEEQELTKTEDADSSSIKVTGSTKNMSQEDRKMLKSIFLRSFLLPRKLRRRFRRGGKHA